MHVGAVRYEVGEATAASPGHERATVFWFPHSLFNNALVLVRQDGKFRESSCHIPGIPRKLVSKGVDRTSKQTGEVALSVSERLMRNVSDERRW